MRNLKTNSREFRTQEEAQRAAYAEARRDPRTWFERCANCDKVAGFLTGYLRLKDEVWICGECVALQPHQSKKEDER